jgi:hypothetical protein
MSEVHSDSREQHVNELIAAYLKAVELGESPDRADLLCRHPDLAGELRSFFADQDAVLPGAVPPQQGATLAHAGSAGAEPVFVRYFGDYELLEEIARGGMGVIYRAKQVSLDRVVALKMILAGQLASAEDVARFHREAEAAANLEHPGIVPIYEIGEQAGQHYFSMKLIEGGSLADRIEKCKGDPRQTAQMLAAVARAVHYAHQRGILHRDLKPANILIDQAGTPYVSDFGLARKVQSDSVLTQQGAIVGTPAYMAPEQARGEKLLSTAADVYALGAILYECLTGRPPFRAATPVDTLIEVLDSEPTPPGELSPNADLELSAVALKCLDKSPSRRYESAEEVVEELEHWLAGEPVRARPIGWLRRRLRWMGRHPALLAVLNVSVGLPILIAWWLWCTGQFTEHTLLAFFVMLGMGFLYQLFELPEVLARKMATKHRRGPLSAPPVHQTVSELRLSVLKATGEGAWMGLALGGALLFFYVFTPGSGRPLPAIGLAWLWNYFFQAALMLALVWGLFRLRGAKGWPYNHFGWWGLLILSMSADHHWVPLLITPLWIPLGIALCGILAVRRLLIEWIRIRSLDRHSATPEEHYYDWWWPMTYVGGCCPTIGFLLGRFVAGNAQPAAFIFPLHGAMLGWAVAGLLLIAVPIPKGGFAIGNPSRGS